MIKQAMFTIHDQTIGCMHSVHHAHSHINETCSFFLEGGGVGAHTFFACLTRALFFLSACPIFYILVSHYRGRGTQTPTSYMGQIILTSKNFFLKETRVLLQIFAQILLEFCLNFDQIMPELAQKFPPNIAQSSPELDRPTLALLVFFFFGGGEHSAPCPPPPAVSHT